MRGERRPRPVPESLGGVERLGRRKVVVRVTVVVLLVAVALSVRFAGLLQPASPLLPPLDRSAQVTDGVMRASVPHESEYRLLRDSFRVRAIVSIGRTTVEEEAETRALGIRLLSLDIGDADAPTAQQLRDVIGLIRSTTASGDVVFLHDKDGAGPVLSLAAMVQLVDGVSLSDVLADLDPEEQGRLTVPQRQALQGVDDALSGTGDATGPYAVLRGVTW
jgi:hypothetical protein